MKKSTKREIQIGVLNIICEIEFFIGFVVLPDPVKISATMFMVLQCCLYGLYIGMLALNDKDSNLIYIFKETYIRLMSIFAGAYLVLTVIDIWYRHSIV